MVIMWGPKNQVKVCPPSPYTLVSCAKGCQQLLLHLTMTSCRETQKCLWSTWTLVAAFMKWN